MFKYALSAALVLTAVGIAHAADKPPNFLPPDALDLSIVLAPPPANDSAQAKAELAEVHRVQAKASAAEKKQAVADSEQDVFIFANVMGANFSTEKLPLASAFFAHVRQAEGEFVNPAKDAWKRPRPPVTDPSIQPCEKLTGSASYPSGHSTGGHLLAIVLAEMVPEKRDAIFNRVEDYAHNRVVCGVHYPSDVEAGRISGAVIAALLMQNANFKSEFGPAKAEVRKVLGLPPQ